MIWDTISIFLICSHYGTNVLPSFLFSWFFPFYQWRIHKNSQIQIGQLFSNNTCSTWNFSISKYIRNKQEHFFPKYKKHIIKYEGVRTDEGRWGGDTLGVRALGLSMPPQNLTWLDDDTWLHSRWWSNLILLYRFP